MVEGLPFNKCVCLKRFVFSFKQINLVDESFLEMGELTKDIKEN